MREVVASMKVVDGKFVWSISIENVEVRVISAGGGDDGLSTEATRKLLSDIGTITGSLPEILVDVASQYAEHIIDTKIAITEIPDDLSGV